MLIGDIQGVEKNSMRSKIFTRTVGYWPLQEASGQALDYSGNGNHASTTNVSSYGVNGSLGGSAMDFDGSDDYIDIGVSSLLDGEVGWTVSAWVYARNLPDYAQVLSSMDFDDDQGFSARINDSKNLLLTFYATNGTRYSVNGTDTLNTGNWIHLVYQKTDSEVVFYVDGISERISESHDLRDNGNNYHIGVRAADDSSNWDGQIAHVRVWDYPLPEASIRALYDASRGGFSESDSRTL